MVSPGSAGLAGVNDLSTVKDGDVFTQTVASSSSPLARTTTLRTGYCWGPPGSQPSPGVPVKVLGISAVYVQTCDWPALSTALVQVNSLSVGGFATGSRLHDPPGGAAVGVLGLSRSSKLSVKSIEP